MTTGSCVTCRWAKWTMTRGARPRVNPNQYGECTYPDERIKLPSCEQSRYIGRDHRGKIWFKSPYINCATWEPATSVDARIAPMGKGMAIGSADQSSSSTCVPDQEIR